MIICLSHFKTDRIPKKHDKPLSVMYWIFTIIFAAGFAAIWLTVYITVRIKVDKMNKMLTR